MNDKLNKRQIKLLDELEAKFNECQNAGIVFEGLQEILSAYDGKKLSKAIKDGRVSLGAGGDDFPTIKLRVLIDSGSDCPWRYVK